MEIRRRQFLIAGSLVTLTGCIGQTNETESTPKSTPDSQTTPSPSPTPLPTPETQTTATPIPTETTTPESQEKSPDNVPDPEFVKIDVPDSATVGEPFTLTIVSKNQGTRGGHWSTITTSFPFLTESDDVQHLSIIQEDFDAWSGTIPAGNKIVDKGGNRIPAEYALAEVGSNADTYWDAGKRHIFSLEITPQERGTFMIYLRTTLTAENDTSTKYNEPQPDEADATDQQGFPVRQIQIDIK